MPYFVKKPIPIKAEQRDEPFTVETLEGTLKGKAGDYLVVGVNGEQYPVDREIFEKTYDQVPKYVYDTYHIQNQE